MPDASAGPVSSSGSRQAARVSPTFALLRTAPATWGLLVCSVQRPCSELLQARGDRMSPRVLLLIVAEPASGAEPLNESKSDAECSSNQHHSGTSEDSSRHGCGEYADSEGRDQCSSQPALQTYDHSSVLTRAHNHAARLGGERSCALFLGVGEPHGGEGNYMGDGVARSCTPSCCCALS
eukprot:536055-Pleurochrysis_carterae.AAC.1